MSDQRKRRDLKTRIRARMEKTGERYSIARMHLLRGEQPAPGAEAPPLRTPEPPAKKRGIRFNIHTELALRDADAALRPTEAERRPKAMAAAQKQLTRLDEHRGATTLQVLEELETAELERLARNLATLPRDHFRRLRDAAEQIEAWKRLVPRIVREMQQVMSSPSIQAARRILEAQEEQTRVAVRQLEDSGVLQALQDFPDPATRAAMAAAKANLAGISELGDALSGETSASTARTFREYLKGAAGEETLLRLQSALSGEALLSTGGVSRL